MCGFQYICRVLRSTSDTKLQWSLSRINCLYISSRVALYCHQILLFNKSYLPVIARTSLTEAGFAFEVNLQRNKVKVKIEVKAV